MMLWRSDSMRRVVAICLVVCLGLMFIGCRGEVPEGTSGAKGNPKRIIILTNGDDPFWDAMRRGMEKASTDLNLEEAGLVAFLDKGDFSEEAQINKLHQYATQSDIAAVGISSVDAKNRGIADAMRELQKKGVFVVCIDSDMDVKKYRDTRCAYLGTNNVIGGQELGKTAKGLLPNGGKYATFVGLKSVANAIERIGGFAQGAGPKFSESDSLADGGDENQAQENVKITLNNHPDINVLVGIWAYNAHAIVQVVKDRNIRNKTTVVVFDAAPLALDDMEQGKIDAMIVQNPYQMGFLGTKLMKALIEKDHNTIQEMYPDYDPGTGKFQSQNGDIFTTELRVVVPDKASPLKPEMFDSNTEFFYFEDFKKWLADRKLTGS
jgi:ribose transport system substrate-binding protein